MVDSLENEGAPAPPKSNKAVLVMAVCAAVCVGAAGGMFVMLQKGGGAAAGGKKGHAAEGEEGGAPAAEEGAAEDAGGEGPVVTMNPFVVNLSDETGEAHYLKCTIAVELSGSGFEKAFESRTPKIRNAVLMYLSNLRTSDIQGVQNKRAMLEHLRNDVQEIVGKRAVRDIYLTEFVIQ